MKVFVLKVMLFLAPLVIGAIGLEKTLANAPNAFTTKRQAIEAIAGEAEVIVTGSSHAYYGVQAPLLHQHSVNVAFPSQDLYYDSRLVLGYLPLMRRLKVAIISVSYFSLEAMLDTGAEAWRSPFYALVFGFPHYDDRPRLADYSWIAAFGAVQTRDFVRGGFVHRFEALDRSGGFGGFKDGAPEAAKSDYEAIVRHRSSMRPEEMGRNGRYLDEMIGQLKSRNVAVVIVTMPCSPTYYGNVDAAAYTRMQTAVRALANARGVDYLNYFTDPDFGWDDFFNADHLSTAGAQKFTRRLKADVVDRFL